MNQVKIYLPPPSNWQDFQSLLKDIAGVRYNPSTVVEYGRQGQRQYGVDVYAEDYFGKKIGIQCKESKDDLSEKEVIKEADEAKSFPTGLDLFIIATTSPTDAKLQSKVMALNGQKIYPFKVRVDFWNDLTNDINRYSMVLNACYQTYRQNLAVTDESQHLVCLRVAFDRPAFKDDFMFERNYDDFEEALASTKRLFRTGFTLDRWSQIPVVQTIPIDFLPDGKYRAFSQKLEADVEKIYKSYLKDKKRILSDPRFAKDRSGHYNITRRALMEFLNDTLRSQGLPEIPIGYS